MTDDEMQSAANAAGFWAERKRGSMFVILPTRRYRWVRETINSDRRGALLRAIDRAKDELASLKTPNVEVKAAAVGGRA